MGFASLPNTFILKEQAITVLLLYYMKKIVKKVSRRAIGLGHGLLPVNKSPDEALGRLFHDVQVKRLNEDGMTFVDAMPKKMQWQVLRAYREASKQPDFDLESFVKTYFVLDADSGAPDLPPVARAEDHINRLWPLLTREAATNKGSIVALPYPYIVPGGRFQCQFYWDSYFVMLGLAESGRWDMIESMYKNYQYMILKFGFIPTANRTYYLSRSQPPFFADMVELMASHNGARRTYIPALPYLLKEYQFWMHGTLRPLKAYKGYRRIVTLENGATLNRYYDGKDTPRPESYKEDLDTAALSRTRDSRKVYRDLRAAAESGWDFTARWLEPGGGLETIQTTNIIPVDLNCLLYRLEMRIARCYELLKQKPLAAVYRRKAKKRAEALMTYCWNEADGYFYDYNFVTKSQTEVASLAGAFPLYAGFVSQSTAERVAAKLQKDFLQPGGLVTTLLETSQQWDAPNGWAPLQWVVVRGLRAYKFNDLAEEIMQRWIDLVMTQFEKKHKLFEKYDVVSLGKFGGGGEYPLQDGFGWTNGVLLAFLNEREALRKKGEWKLPAR